MKKLLWLGFIGSCLSLICDFLLGWMCLLNPLAAKVLLNAVAVIAPNTALSNGLGMANMALGRMIPFLGILIWLTRNQKEATA